MPGERLVRLDARSAIVLNNITCVYCNTLLDEAESTKEHTIGRRFVPKGTLARSWNLIVRACGECNGRKSDLEDDLSAVSMHPDSAGDHARDDEILVSEATRKAAKSSSRRQTSWGQLRIRRVSGAGKSGSHLQIQYVFAPAVRR